MSELTKRDKLLIYFLALALFIFALIYWVYLPAARNYSDYKAQYDSASARRTLIDDALSGVPSLQADVDSLAAQLEAAKAAFMPLGSQGQVDLYLTGLIQGFGLEPISMAVAPPAKRAFAPFGGNANLDEQALLPDVDSPTGMVWTIDAVFTGSMGDFNRLADALTQERGLYLQSFSCTGPQEGVCSFSATFIGVSDS